MAVPSSIACTRCLLEWRRQNFTNRIVSVWNSLRHVFSSACIIVIVLMIENDNKQ